MIFFLSLFLITLRSAARLKQHEIYGQCEISQTFFSRFSSRMKKKTSLYLSEREREASITFRVFVATRSCVYANMMRREAAESGYASTLEDYSVMPHDRVHFLLLHHQSFALLVSHVDAEYILYRCHASVIDRLRRHHDWSADFIRSSDDQVKRAKMKE